MGIWQEKAELKHVFLTFQPHWCVFFSFSVLVGTWGDFFLQGDTPSPVWAALQKAQVALYVSDLKIPSEDLTRWLSILTFIIYRWPFLRWYISCLDSGTYFDRFKSGITSKHARASRCPTQRENYLVLKKTPKTTAQIIKYAGLQPEVSRFPPEPKGDWVLRFQMSECDTVCAQSNDNTTARVASNIKRGTS